MNKTVNMVMHIKARPWIKLVLFPFVLLKVRVPRCVLRMCFKITGPHPE